MKFKQFIKILEDNGLMGFPVASSARKPSDGQPFKNNGSVAGQTPRGANSGGGMNNAGKNPMFMKKKMKKD